MPHATAVRDGTRVAVVIVNYRTPDLAIRCVEALRKERGQLPNLKVVVVDGGSGDGSAELLTKSLSSRRYRGWVQFQPLHLNGGFGWANNEAIRLLLRSQDSPAFIHLLNPDAEIEEGASAILLRAMQSDDSIGAAGSQLLNVDGSPVGSAFSFPTIRGEFARGARTRAVERLLNVSQPSWPPQSTVLEVEWVTGASVMLRSKALEEAGLFDDGFFLYHEEVELMWRLRKGGWKIVHQPASRVRHIGGAATGLHGRTGAKTLPRRPSYWYQSRRRFFARTRGRHVAVLAALSWVVGHLFWSARCLLGSARERKSVHRELLDQLRFGVFATIDGQMGQLASNVPEGNKPLWMRCS